MDISRIVRQLLENRGITREEEIEEYLSPKPRLTHDPFLMKGMDQAVEMILSHAKKKSRICVYGDYDCDGVSSIYVLTTVLKQLTDEDLISHYIPSRFEEGYGLKDKAIQKIAERGTDLLITVDLGITQAEEVRLARSLGMDVIITDHHNPGKEIPDCIVLDPKQKDCGYPFNGICGCGVAYKVAQALQRTAGFDREVIVRLLDIVGIATIGDVVPLVDENRTIAKYGLYEIRSGRRKNINILLDTMSRDYRRIDSYGVSFGIVPHINAAGRMEDAENAYSLLTAEDDDEIRKYAGILAGYNDERKKVQEDAFERCLALMEEQCPGSRIPVIRDDKAHEGIVGIVAGKLANRLNRPAVVLTEKDGALKGSGRSIDGVDLYSIISACSDKLQRFGGHVAACGLTLAGEEDLDEFRSSLEKEMDKLLQQDPSLLEDKGRFDLVIEPEEVTLETAMQIEAMEPFGNANEKPAFKLEGMQLSRGILMGEKMNHIKFNGEKRGSSVQCIAFFCEDELIDRVLKEPVADVIGRMQVNDFRGRKSVQFVVDKVLV